MFIPIQIHSSALPVNRYAALHRSLKTRAIHPRLHYQTAEQSHKWLLVHRKFSPAVARVKTFQIYKKAAVRLIKNWDLSSAHIVSLGCGDGNKDILFLQSFYQHKHSIQYVPCDINTELVLQATIRAARIVPFSKCMPTVCDLEHTKDFNAYLNSKLPVSIPRIFLFFGILPNMEVRQAQRCLRSLLRPKDILLISANLAPDSDYLKSVRSILPQYDNPETRDWLLTLLDGLGVSKNAGKLHFAIRPANAYSKLKKIEAIYLFKRSAAIIVEKVSYKFKEGDTLSLFFSYRYTQTLAQEFLASLGVSMLFKCLDDQGEETVLGGVYIK